MASYAEGVCHVCEYCLTVAVLQKVHLSLRYLESCFDLQQRCSTVPSLLRVSVKKHTRPAYVIAMQAADESRGQYL